MSPTSDNILLGTQTTSRTHIQGDEIISPKAQRLQLKVILMAAECALGGRNASPGRICSLMGQIQPIAWF